MLSGAEYRESVRDGRKVWVLGEGAVGDVTTHPSTKAMVDEYAAWYDRHTEPKWRNTLLSSSGEPWAFSIPRSADDLRRMGRSYSETLFLSAGNVTHTPGYGNLIALGILEVTQRLFPGTDRVGVASRYRDSIASTGAFLTYCAGNATVGYRMRPDPAQRAAVTLVKERDDGIVVRGRLSMHTAPAFANEIYVGRLSLLNVQGFGATFAVAANSPGVTIICRKIAQRHKNPFIAPLSSRFDELDGAIWLDDVFIPWEKVFLLGDAAEPPNPISTDPIRGDGIGSWLFWHQLYCWLAKAEFTLGTALASMDVMGLRNHDLSREMMTDVVSSVQTVRSCLVAAELDPLMTPQGEALPNLLHVAAGSLAMLNARQRITEILRIMPGSSLVMSPADSDLASPEIGSDLEETLSGGGYSAMQRAALLNLAWDLVSSGLDARESAFELHANGGVQVWRTRMRAWFEDYDRLANGALQALSVEMPPLDFSALRTIIAPVRRPVEPRPT